ncbi:hypothetical protein M514_06220 [Trichuris suis]|uniref:Uncharacterized protein n=1 Tax=Trichuris suis TaxID=68888 RepID=A0A085M6R4_9BILA|nr:hypothetical protein M513_06220 [Trichuris suis]KFD63728.1 hypothetical protein M514_06220 [Trichuris suis]
MTYFPLAHVSEQRLWVVPFVPWPVALPSIGAADGRNSELSELTEEIPTDQKLERSKPLQVEHFE